MTKYKIEIDTGNDAFECISEEIARILRRLIDRIEDEEGFDFTLRDLNGNIVGSTYLED